MRRLPALVTTAITAVLCGQLVAPVAAAAEGFTVRETKIAGSGGISLAAKVIEPEGAARTPRPLLVMPASWAVPNIEYVGAAARLAHESGYVVVSYTARGFYGSGGEVEVAGAEDVADARRVIDWAVEHTSAGDEHIGMAGISYGAGISALTAAEDSRVDAVAAMSGWADLVASLYPNETVSSAAAELLLGSGKITGRLGSDLRELERAYRQHRVEDELHMARERSPKNRIDQLNANGTAVLLANAWQDSLFPPGQITDMFGRLNGPKRLMLSPGDHATPELFGAAGLPNRVWERTAGWFDQHLRGIDRGIPDSGVELQPLNSSEWHSYSSWDAASRRTATHHLAEPRKRHPFAPETGGLPTGEQPSWQHRIDAGDPTLANSGAILVSGALQGFTRIPVGVSLPLVDREDAAVWATEPYSEEVMVSGAPRLSVTATPSAESVSLFAHLYDVGPAGNGSLISRKPVTLRDGRPGVQRLVEVSLRPTAWEVPAGHRLALVIDTVDTRYRDESSAGTVTFGSSKGSPASLRVPFG
ncbi:CocE/NonD family hydrolase [Actinopolyspora halophila]|uniref:CocE/NonD family hydrolase n=1 Tax=Actinopolyspora halophila TaxID=1850 RepID=UPI0003611104|nr:CocE/NonD family hydrolase [Actinopolyspora halophila]